MKDAPVDSIRLIRDKAELNGTCYFELLPGKYRGRCWNEESVFLAESVFGFIEPIIARHEPRFDHYAFESVSRETWMRIMDDIEQLAERVRNAKHISELRETIGFLFKTTEKEFSRDFKVNANALAELTGELIIWLQEQLKQHPCVSILGM
jgi:hypothetical protein